MPEIQRVSIRHEAILDHLIANPTAKLGEVASEFRVSQAWLSCIIHSDAFQRLLREKQGEIFSSCIVPLREKMNAIAHQVLDKIADKIPTVEDIEQLRETSDSLLDRLGYGSGSQRGGIASHQTNVFIGEGARDALARARQLIGRTEARPALEGNADAVLGTDLRHVSELHHDPAVQPDETSWPGANAGGAL